MARIMIASDIHGDAQTTELLLRRYSESGAEKLVLLGDILYHGPRNDLPAGYAPKAVIELLSRFKNEIICVRGNCDTEVDQMVLPFPVLADYAYLYLDGVRIFATHGHNYNKDKLPPICSGDVLLHGHTHVPVGESFGDGFYYVNPGSVSIPKENSPKSYVIYENGVFSFFNLEGTEYKKFDLKENAL